MDKNITVLAGCQTPESWSVTPFDPVVCRFVQELSETIRTDANYQQDEIRAFGYWLRQGNLKKIIPVCKEGDMGIGMVFHIVAANVPCLFAYSLTMSILCGNANVLRLSDRCGKQDQALVELFRQLLCKQEYQDLYRRTSIVTYDKDDSITRSYLNQSDAYVVWGGDATVSSIRLLVTNPDLVELVFPDRYSVAVFGMSEFVHKTEQDLQVLVHHFYNDTYSVNQNACSSPRMIFWLNDGVGHDDAIKLKQRFWECLKQEILEYSLEDDMAYRKLNAVTQSIMKSSGVQSVNMQDLKLIVVDLEHIDQPLESYEGTCGVFYQMEMMSIEELAKHCSKKLQTICCHGVDKKELFDSLIQARAKGVRRIVSVGEALFMLDVWDGKNVYSVLTKSLL